MGTEAINGTESKYFIKNCVNRQVFGCQIKTEFIYVFR